MATEKTYRLELTRRQLYILSEQMNAVADPGHRDADELALLELIEQTHRRAWTAERSGKPHAQVASAKEPGAIYERYLIPATIDRPLFTAQVDSDELRIEVGNRTDLAFTLTCNLRRNGSPAFLELPRRYQTVRGAKLAAAKLMGERLEWKPAQGE
ncbi:hypothetical protein [Pseudomonas sp. NPDC090208]|uniref:hypothetical protein n=1 Tax=Pseudomonas sp. NPDC090208 TaxID=3364478 RepID=UPI003828D714